MKILILLLAALISTTTFATDQNQKIDFDQITSQQLSSLTNQCLDNDYSGNICKQLKTYQDERTERMKKEAIQSAKYSHF